MARLRAVHSSSIRPGVRRALLALVAGVPMVGAGCGSSVTTTSGGGTALTATSTGLASQGYLAESSTEVAFIQLTVTGANLAGTFDVSDLKGTSVTPVHVSFTGTASGGTITLSINAGLGSTTNIQGAIDGKNLVLNFPQASGAIVSMTFTPSDTGTYHQALQALTDQAGANFSSSVSASVSASQAAASSAAQAQLDRAVAQSVDAVNGDIGSLQRASGFPDSSSSTVLAQQQSDLVTMRKDEDEARAAPDQNSRCTGAYTVQSQAYAVQSDYYGVRSNGSAVTSTALEMQRFITTLDADFKALQAAAQADSQHPGTVPTQAQVSAAEAPVGRAIAANQAAAAHALDQAKSVADSALAEAKTFTSQMCG